MTIYELIGRSVCIAAAVLFLLTLFDLAGGESLRVWDAAQAFFRVLDGVAL